MTGPRSHIYILSPTLEMLIYLFSCNISNSTITRNNSDSIKLSLSLIVLNYVCQVLYIKDDMSSSYFTCYCIYVTDKEVEGWKSSNSMEKHRDKAALFQSLVL
jgi:ferredoxin-thioredoxin reductase catalytic subunit